MNFNNIDLRTQCFMGETKEQTTNLREEKRKFRDSASLLNYIKQDQEVSAKKSKENTLKDEQKAMQFTFTG